MILVCVFPEEKYDDDGSDEAAQADTPGMFFHSKKKKEKELNSHKGKVWFLHLKPCFMIIYDAVVKMETLDN